MNSPGSTTAKATLIGLSQPALADPHGNLFVANLGSNTVSEFTPGSTSATATLHGLSDAPVSLAFDSNGDLFVGADGTIKQFVPGATTPTATLIGLSEPRSLLFDATGDLFAANFGGNTVSEFTPGATTAGVTLTGLGQPEALAFDTSGDPFVVNNGVSTVSEFAAAGSVPVVTTSSTALSYNVNSGPQAVDPAITVTDSKSSTIVSATVAIASGYKYADDTLAFTNQNGTREVSIQRREHSAALRHGCCRHVSGSRSVTFSSTTQTRAALAPYRSS